MLPHIIHLPVHLPIKPSSCWLPKPNVHPSIDSYRLNLQKNQRTVIWLGRISAFICRGVSPWPSYDGVASFHQKQQSINTTIPKQNPAKVMLMTCNTHSKKNGAQRDVLWIITRYPSEVYVVQKERRKQLGEQTVEKKKHMCNDIFVSYFIPAVNSNPRCDTSRSGPVPPICNSVSGRLPGQPGKLWGQREATGASGARQSGLLGGSAHFSHGGGVGKTDVKRKQHRGLPGERICAGIRGPSRPGSASHAQNLLGWSLGRREGPQSYMLGGALQFCPISPSLTM